jgi:ElaA protein
VIVHRSAWADLDPLVLHDIVRLRVDVFVVEQACAYPELDGRDVEPGTEHVWTTDGAGVSAYLRVPTEPDGSRRIGRVVTRSDARGAGLSARLVADVVARHADVPIVLNAQAHLAGFYTGFGFAATGPEFLDDGIPHVPMRREPSQSGSATAGP